MFGTGRQLRDFNYVDDVADALMLAAAEEKCYGNIYNLGAPTHYSILDLINVLDPICGISYAIVPFPADKKIIDIGDYYGDYSLFSQATGWQPKIDLHEGMARTIAFYKQNKKNYLA